jgi:lipocalin
MVAIVNHQPLFPLGQIVATPGALEALNNARQSPVEFLARHAQGDWGEVCAEDRVLNDEAVKDGSRILSAYRTKLEVKIWVITEADRSSTCLLLPDEY